MANAVPNSFDVMLWKGQIAGGADTFKIILLEAGFVFDQDAHHAYADVSAYELPTGNGYTAGGITLTGVAIIVDNATNRAEVTWDNVQWDVVTGSLVYSGAILYNDSTDAGGGTDDYTDAIVSYKDAGGAQTATPGTPIIVSQIKETVGSRE